MASLTLGTVGSMVGGPLGGAIGAAVGGYLDENVILPALFPPEDMHGPRLDDLKIQSGQEGAHCYFLLGPECRIAGNFLWCPDLIEVKTKQKQGKGSAGGAGGSQYTYDYYLNCAIEICDGRQVNSITKIFANGKLIYDNDPDIEITSASLSVVKEITLKWDPTAYGGGWIGLGAWVVDKTFAVFNSPNGGPDLSQVRSGLDVTISGFTIATGNNGTFRVVSSAYNSSDGTSTFKVKNDNAAAYTPGSDSILIEQDLPNKIDYINSLTFYDGTQTTANSLIEGTEGAGTVPAFKGKSYFVINSMHLKNFGNGIPQFSIIAKADTSLTLQTAIGEILERCKNITASLYDVSGLSGNLRGYPIRGPMGIDKQLQPILIAHDILTQEDQGVIKFFHRADATEIEVENADLAAHVYGGDIPRQVSWSNRKDLDLPAEVNVKYIDPDNNLQTGSQQYQKIDPPTSRMNNFELPITIQATEAKSIAKRLTYTPYARKRMFNISLPPSYMHIQENDILTFSAYIDRDRTQSRNFRAITQKVDMGINGLIKVNMTREVASAIEFTSEADDAYPQTIKLFIPPDTITNILDIAALKNEHAYSPGYYIGCTNADTNAQWVGAALYISSDGSEYVLKDNVQYEATMGTAITELGGSVTGASWDMVNTVQVKMVQGVLENYTKEQVLAGLNRALIGKEIIGYCNATLVDTDTYELSCLLRGLRDTIPQIDNHETEGEPFIALNDYGMNHYTMNPSDMGATKYFKCVVFSGDIDDYDADSGKIYGKTTRPFAPCDGIGTRDGSNNLTINWTRRSRGVVKIVSEIGVPLIEAVEKYEIDIYNTAGTAIIATKYITGDPTYSYTATEQSTDTLTPGDPVKMDIYQIGAIYGRGRAYQVTL